MKSLLLVFICSLVVSSFATTYRTEAIDGADGFAGDELMDIVSFIEFRLTWDADSFYFSIKGPFNLDFQEDWWVFIDVNQTNGVGATATSPSPSIVTFNGSADTKYEPEFAVHIASSAVAIFYSWLGSAWDAGVSLSPPVGTHAVVLGYAEFSLAFSAMVPGLPHDGFCISSSVEDPGGIPPIIISAYPIENPAGAGGNVLPDVNWFYQFYTPHVPSGMPVAGFSPSGIDHSLPVSLMSFNAIGGDNEVLLKWVTASEVENDAFLLEKSTDQQNFTRIAEIDGQGNSNSQTNYSFTDNNVINGRTYYYRLSDRDFNGNITYHPMVSATPLASGDVVQVNDIIPFNFNLNQNYPNPFNPSTTIEFELPTTGEDSHPTRLSVYDMQGKKVRTLVNGTFAPGIYKVVWDGRDEQGNPVSSGAYIYELKTENIHLTRQMVFLR
ncbi:MAG: FlgD immunoglobulin-like domain containing protein [Calditrichia bacterium]